MSAINHATRLFGGNKFDLMRKYGNNPCKLRSSRSKVVKDKQLWDVIIMKNYDRDKIENSLHPMSKK